jgi:GTP-binding protein HflX
MLQNIWLAKDSENTIFISAKDKQNIDKLRELMYNNIKRIHAIRYPYNNFLY